MKCPKAAIFDLDDTLAESFQPPRLETVEKLKSLLDAIPVSIMSGAGFERIERDFLYILEKSPNIALLYLFPNSATQCMTWHGGWNEEYNLVLTADERKRIKDVISEASRELPVINETKHYGEQVADRGAQIAFTIVGLDAPQNMKTQWDPDAAKRRIIKNYLVQQLPEFDVCTGGASTIDITRKGINKAYGVKWLSERLKIPASEMLYVGDALYEGGNDAVVIPTGIQTRSVSGPAETLTVINDLLLACQ